MGLARRSITSVTWRAGSNIVRILIVFVRTVLLARILPIEIFGIYTLSRATVELSVVFANMGFGSAFLHRAPETEDESQTAAAHFTLKLIFTVIWAVLMLSGALFLSQGPRRTALLILTLATVGDQLTQTPRAILVRRVVHRRLALIQTSNAVVSTLIAVGLAWAGETLWALLAIDIVMFVVPMLLIYVWRPVWRPRLIWAPKIFRYFFSFGFRSFLASLLLKAIDRVDDLWAGTFLGDAPLGFYSRAYKFATYPREIVAKPVNNVSQGTYAELKGNRKRLSQAFFRTIALLVRTGFLLGGSLALVAPEFIRIFIGVKWMPMLDAFRLMLVFTLLDPLKTTIANLFNAMGKPEKIIYVRLFQLAILLVGLFLLGPRFDITGVAIAVDFMLVAGVGLLLWLARDYVDFSPRKLFLVPTLALSIGLILARGTLLITGVLGSDWRTGFVKLVVFIPVFGTILFVLERRSTIKMVEMIIRSVKPKKIDKV